MHSRKWRIGGLIIIWGLLTWGSNLHAQTGYDLRWFSVDGGGATSNAEGYALRGAAGQADAGQLSTGDYTLTGGVLTAIDAPPDPPSGSTLFMPKLNR